MGSVGRSKDCRPQYQYTNKVNRCRKSKRQKQNKPTWLHHGWVYQYILRRIPEWTRLQSSHCLFSTRPSGMVLSQIRIVQKILASWSIRGESLEKTDVLQLISEKKSTSQWLSNLCSPLQPENASTFCFFDTLAAHPLTFPPQAPITSASTRVFVRSRESLRPCD